MRRLVGLTGLIWHVPRWGVADRVSKPSGGADRAGPTGRLREVTEVEMPGLSGLVMGGAPP